MLLDRAGRRGGIRFQRPQSGLSPQSWSLRTQAGVDAAASYATDDLSPLLPQRVSAVRRLAQRLPLVLEQAKALASQIEALARDCGVSLLTAGALAGILGPGRRFATDAQLAAYAGVAPLEASSAERARHRLNRGGHRRRNAIL